MSKKLPGPAGRLRPSRVAADPRRDFRQLQTLGQPGHAGHDDEHDQAADVGGWAPPGDIWVDTGGGTSLKRVP